MKKIKTTLLFDSNKYSIKRVAGNYKIHIKLPKKPKFRMDRDCYSQPEFGLNYAHETADGMIIKYFIDGIDW